MAGIQDIIARLPPEQQGAAAEFLQAHPEAVPELLPERSDQEIGNVVGSALGDARIGQQQGRLERALMKAQGSENELMAGISGPKNVATPFGAVAVRQSPIMNIVKALRAYKGGQMAQGEDEALSGLYGDQADRLTSFYKSDRENSRKGNSDAVARLMALMQGGGY